jgi:hypothetical protein
MPPPILKNDELLMGRFRVVGGEAFTCMLQKPCTRLDVRQKNTI